MRFALFKRDLCRLFLSVLNSDFFWLSVLMCFQEHVLTQRNSQYFFMVCVYSVCFLGALLEFMLIKFLITHLSILSSVENAGFLCSICIQVISIQFIER